MLENMLNYNEVKPGVAVIVEGEPYVCTWNNIMQKQQRRPVNQTKLRHLIRGNVIEYSFQQSDKLQEAEIDSKPAVFVFHDARKGEWVFHETSDKSKRFSVDDEKVGEAGQFLKPNTEVETLWFDEKLFRVKLPIKMDLQVTEAPPNVRGNTAQGGSKVVTLETGASIQAPLFIEEGDVVRINTETGEYVERA
jgi:elongation factor P